MQNNLRIVSWVLIRNRQIVFDGETIFEQKDNSTVNFLQTAYEALHINYPRFFKMDNLCKIGFLAAEILLRNRKLKEKYSAEKVSIVFSCANSSLDTDIRYLATMDTAPSPGLFVYTLPNVLTGELCIRNQIKGEAACFVFNIFDPGFQSEYINLLFETNKTEAGVSGWADYYNNEAEAFFYLVEQTEQIDLEQHNSVNVTKIFETI